MLSIKLCLHTQLPNIMEATEKFPGVGAFDHMEWTYNGAFEQLFGLQKFKCPGGGYLSFDLTGT